MLEHKYATALQGLIQVTEGTLATIEYICLKSKVPKQELKRQISIAQVAMDCFVDEWVKKLLEGE
jgi:hypothetical protein